MQKSVIYIGLLSIFCAFTWVSCKHEIPKAIDPGQTPYSIEIPPLWTPMPIPEDNPFTVEGIELGRFLFWEKALSSDHTMSCGSCHLPEFAFSDDEQFSTGVTGAQGTRQSMSLVNVGWQQFLFWDGRSSSLEEQIIEPVEADFELNNTWDNALQDLRAIDYYPEMFRLAFGSEEINQERVTKAIAQFMRTMISANSKFDKSRRGDLELTDSEQRGFELFITEGGDPEVVENGGFGADCFHCHKDQFYQFTDFGFHNNGLDTDFTDLGLGGVTSLPGDMGKFRTPTLRNVELSAPYMHDGRFQTLEEVIDHYDSGGQPSETISSFMKFTTGGLELSPQSKEDLLAFLKTLTDNEFIENPAFSDPHE